MAAVELGEGPYKLHDGLRSSGVAVTVALDTSTTRHVVCSNRKEVDNRPRKVRKIENTSSKEKMSTCSCKPSIKSIMSDHNAILEIDRDRLWISIEIQSSHRIYDERVQAVEGV